MDQNNPNNNISLNASGSRFSHLRNEEDSVNGSLGEDMHEEKEKESITEGSTIKEMEDEVVQRLNMTKSVPYGDEETIDKTVSSFVNLACSYGHISADNISSSRKNMTKIVLNYKGRFKSQSEEDVKHCLPQEEEIIGCSELQGRVNDDGF